MIVPLPHHCPPPQASPTTSAVMCGTWGGGNGIKFFVKGDLWALSVSI